MASCSLASMEQRAGAEGKAGLGLGWRGWSWLGLGWRGFSWLAGLCTAVGLLAGGLLVWTWALGGGGGSHGYPDWARIEELLAERQAEYSSQLAVEVVGRSVMNRSIYSVTVGLDLPATAPTVWLICGLHAREWTSPLACLHLLDRLLEERREDSLLRRIQFRLLPLVNPDSYVYTMTPTGDDFDRLKRKNMADTGCQDALFGGVDLNRNFPVGFESRTSSCLSYSRSWQAPHRSPYCGCDQAFPGPRPFSEPETRAVRAALTGHGPPWLVLDIHGSQGVWMTPMASKPRKAGEEVPEAWHLDFLTAFLQETYGVTYTSGRASDVMGLIGGSMLDWLHEDLGVQRAYAVELTR